MCMVPSIKRISYSIRWRLMVASCSILFVAGPDAVKAQVLSLDSVLTLVEQNNPALRAYDSRIAGMEEYVSGATSWMAPMVGAGTFMTPYPGQSGMEGSARGSWMFSVEQEIPHPARQRANAQYLRSRAAVEEEARAQRFNDLRSQAKTFYYQWLVNEERLRLLNDAEEIMTLMLKLAKIRHPYNQGNLGGIYRAEGRLAEVQNAQMMTRGEIEFAQAQLKALMALPSSATMQVDTAITPGFNFDPSAYDTATLSQVRSDVRGLEARIAVTRLNQQLQRLQSKPEFRIRFDHMQPIANMPPQYSLMGMISLPIAPWSSERYKSSVRGIEREIESMNHDREAVLLEAHGRLTSMTARIRQISQQLENYSERILPALEKNYRVVMLAYEENREQLPAVIDAWEALNSARMEYLTKKDEYYKMIVAYEKEIEK